MRIAWIALLAAGCREPLQDPVESGACKVLDLEVCQVADDHSDFTYVQSQILKKNCTGTSCHQAGGSDPKAAMLRFEDYDAAYETLVGRPDPEHPDDPDKFLSIRSRVRKDQINTDDEFIVAPKDPDKSYLLFLMREVSAAEWVGEQPILDPPSDVGYMPRSNNALCCQKLGAVRRWIENGAAKD